MLYDNDNINTVGFLYFFHRPLDRYRFRDVLATDANSYK